MKVGLFFGSFNPIHTGHLLIANYFIEFAGLDKVWFVVSPQNPFKTIDVLLDENVRLEMIQLAIGHDDRFVASDIEFNLPRPSFTVSTLNYLRNTFPEDTFYPIIGGDNLQSFHLWKDYMEILEKHKVYVYRRAGYHENPILANHERIRIFEVPLLNISSTYIREMIQAGKSIKYLVPEEVEKFIIRGNLYQQ